MTKTSNINSKVGFEIFDMEEDDHKLIINRYPFGGRDARICIDMKYRGYGYDSSKKEWAIFVGPVNKIRLCTDNRTSRDIWKDCYDKLGRHRYLIDQLPKGYCRGELIKEVLCVKDIRYDLVYLNLFPEVSIDEDMTVWSDKDVVSVKDDAKYDGAGTDDDEFSEDNFDEYALERKLYDLNKKSQIVFK